MPAHNGHIQAANQRLSGLRMAETSLQKFRLPALQNDSAEQNDSAGIMILPGKVPKSAITLYINCTLGQNYSVGRMILLRRMILPAE